MERTIRECLGKMKRKDLADLGFRLNLPPPGKRGALDAWRDMAADCLPELGATVRECLGYKGVIRLRRCLQGAAEQGNELTIPRTDGTASSALRELGVLRQLALAWMDQRQLWHIQACVADMLTLDYGERSLLEASDDLEICIRGYLMHYGMLAVEKVQEMILGRRDERAENVVLAVHARRCGLNGVVFTEREGVWLCLPELGDPAALAVEIMRPDRQMIDYAPCTEEAARRAARDGVTGDEKLLARLIEAARYSGVSKRELLLDVSLAESVYQEEDRGVALDTMLMSIDEKRRPAAELIADRYLNTVPVWRVKGHTVMEARQEDKPTGLRWKDRCPCGSGRTWGSCCGRAQ